MPYKAVWEVFILFDTPPTVPGFPFKRGVQRLMRDIEVDGDQMTFNASSQFFDQQRQPALCDLRQRHGKRALNVGKDDD